MLRRKVKSASRLVALLAPLCLPLTTAPGWIASSCVCSTLCSPELKEAGASWWIHVIRLTTHTQGTVWHAPLSGRRPFRKRRLPLWMSGSESPTDTYSVFYFIWEVFWAKALRVSTTTKSFHMFGGLTPNFLTFRKKPHDFAALSFCWGLFPDCFWRRRLSHVTLQHVWDYRGARQNAAGCHPYLWPSNFITPPLLQGGGVWHTGLKILMCNCSCNVQL